jgi:hypothetical protein
MWKYVLGDEVDDVRRMEGKVRGETLRGLWELPEDERNYRPKCDHYNAEFILESIFRLHHYTEESMEHPDLPQF